MIFLEIIFLFFFEKLNINNKYNKYNKYNNKYNKYINNNIHLASNFISMNFRKSSVGIDAFFCKLIGE